MRFSCVAGCQLVEALAHLDVAEVRRHLEARVGEALDLFLHGGDDERRAVADVGHRDSRRQVDQSVAVDVLDDPARGPGHEDTEGRSHPGRDRRTAPVHEPA